MQFEEATLECVPRVTVSRLKEIFHDPQSGTKDQILRPVGKRCMAL